MTPDSELERIAVARADRLGVDAWTVAVDVHSGDDRLASDVDDESFWLPVLARLDRIERAL